MFFLQKAVAPLTATFFLKNESKYIKCLNKSIIDIIELKRLWKGEETAHCKNFFSYNNILTKPTQCRK